MPSTSSPNPNVAARSHRAATYRKVLDQRKRPIRGLWRRNGRYYAQLTVEDLNTGAKHIKRLPLKEATTDSQAVAKLQELLTQRRKGALPSLRPLKWIPRKRDLVSAADIERLCQTTLQGAKTGEKFKNGQQFTDYVKRSKSAVLNGIKVSSRWREG